jgi:peptide/nickel transport system substrate-binding protein
MRILPALSTVGLLLLVGCAHIETRDAGVRHPWTIPHVLRIGEFAEPDTLNPYLSEMDVSYAIASLVYSYLVISDDRGRLVPDLATQVPTLANRGISGDGLTYTYHLRRGVRWHDGAVFTARDVVASWRAVVDPAHLTLFRNGYDRIVSISTPDDYTAVVHLRERYPPFVSQFFTPLQEGAKPVLAAHILDSLRDFNRGELAERAIGTGPFKLGVWNRGESLTLTRNDAYFKGKPRLERIEYRFIPDPQTAVTEMRLHRIDLIETPPLALWSLLQTLSGTHVSLGPWHGQGLLLFNERRAGLDDPVVRKAISLAVDRAEVVRTATHGTAEIARDIEAPGQLGYVRRPLPPFDERAASAMLERAGWRRNSEGTRAKNGISLDYTIATLAGSPTFESIAVELQSTLRTLGVTLAIKPYAYRQMFTPEGPLLSGRFDLAIIGSVLSWDPDSHVYYGCNERYPHGQNIYGYCNPAYDALERRALESDDPAVRAPLYAAADGILWNDVAYMPLYQMRRIIAHNEDLKNYRPNATSAPWWNAWEWDI